MQCNTLLLLVWWIALGFSQYKDELVRLGLASEVPPCYEAGGPLYIAARFSFPLIGREGTPQLAPNFGRGLGLLGGRATILAAQWGRRVTSPSSSSAVQDSFHQRGKLWAPLWREQQLALLYTSKGYVLRLRR